jgi:methionyl-tRNA synthetase
MAEKYRGSHLSPAGSGGRLAQVGNAALRRYRASMDVFALHDGVAAAFQIVDAANEFIAETSPWTLARTPGDAGRLDEVLFEVAEALRVAAVLLRPIMPASSAEILQRVGETTAPDALRLDRDGRWRGEGARQIAKGPPLWPRVEGGPEGPPLRPNVEAGLQTRLTKEVIVEEKPGGTTPAEDGRISIDDFMKLDLRVAKVLEAEAVPKSRKLLKLKVDTGSGQRTIVAGIAEAYQPEQLVGRTIVMVVNLKPAKLMGIESNGMVLAASPDGGAPILLAFDQAPAPGTRIR